MVCFQIVNPVVPETRPTPLLRQPHSQCEAYNADQTRLTLRVSALISMYFMSGDSFQVDQASRFPRSYNVDLVKGYARARLSTRLTSTRSET